MALLDDVQTALKSNGDCICIVTKVVSKTANTVTVKGRSYKNITFQSSDVVNFATILPSNSAGPQIVIFKSTLKTPFDDGSQYPCPTTIAKFRLVGGNLDFDLI